MPSCFVLRTQLSIPTPSTLFTAGVDVSPVRIDGRVRNWRFHEKLLVREVIGVANKSTVYLKQVHLPTRDQTTCHTSAIVPASSSSNCNHDRKRGKRREDVRKRW